jgi:hypothetical protein
MSRNLRPRATLVTMLDLGVLRRPQTMQFRVREAGEFHLARCSRSWGENHD